jgi:hypothetical protein
MKLLLPASLALALALSALSPAHASQMSPTQAWSPGHLTAQTFRLQVQGTPAAGSTFWVAFGPLDGRFGLIRLKSAGTGWYTARARLPRQGRTVFAFLAGQGVLHATFGLAPGNPVVTIRRVGPVEVGLHDPITAHWDAPVG